MLKRSKDRKVTNGVSPNGKTATIANSFGLPAGLAFSCPGQTSVCGKVCYAGKLERIYSGVRDVLMHNWEQVKDAKRAKLEMLIDEMIREFVSDCERKGADKYFRIHWDGDFFSLDYARAWEHVVSLYPDVQFWAYTRSFTDSLNVVPILAGISNLTLYLSADADNIDVANQRAAEYPGVYIATLADTFAEARETIIDTARKSYACPENRKSIPLITEKGSACGRCGICIDGRGDVLFSVKKR